MGEHRYTNEFDSIGDIIALIDPSHYDADPDEAYQHWMNATASHWHEDPEDIHVSEFLTYIEDTNTDAWSIIEKFVESL